jgi:putative aldouronate transport system substrate-binding protein
LEAFKTQDPNHNGKADEIPFAFLGPWDLKFLAHAFGLTANDYNVYVDASGKVGFMPGEEKYREFVAWLTELYGGKLLDQSGFITADTMRTVTDENAPATYGMIMGPTPGSFLPVSQRKQFVLLPPLSYNGTQVYRDFVGPIGRGAFAITSACQDPATLLQWVDFLYTEEGGRLAFAGLENTEYAINADNGTWRLLGSPEEVSAISQSASRKSRRRSDTARESSSLRAGASPSQNGIVGGAPCASRTRTVPPATCITCHDALPSWKMSPTLLSMAKSSLSVPMNVTSGSTTTR